MPQTSQRPLDLPRWEWRTLATSLGDLRFALRGVPIERVRHIEETYLLCARSSHNAKIREGLMDLKWRKQVGRHGLELWDPVLKSTFPCEAEVLLLLGQVYLKQDKPRDARDTFRRLTLQYPNGSLAKQAQVYLDYITERFKELPAPTLKPDFDVGRQRTFCPNILGKSRNYKTAPASAQPGAAESKPEASELAPVD